MTNLLPCNHWADKLALKPADLAPDKRERLRAHLATCSGCAATYADYQSLITRLRALPRPALPPLAPLTPDLLAEPSTPEQLDGLYDNLDAAWLTPPASESAPPTRLPPSRRSTWLQRLSTLAAVLLVTVLVGSLVAVLLHRGSNTSGGADLSLRPGWQQIVTYSGTGSRTITGQHVTLPYLWGSAFVCKGNGAVNIKVSGPTYIGDFGIEKCSLTAGIKVSPNGISLETTIVDQIDTIKVTASAGTSWYLQYTAAVSQPTFRLGPQWASGIGLSGNGAGSSLMGQGPTTVNGQQLQSTVWGALFVCIGAGSGTIHLESDTGVAPLLDSQAFPMAPCDGQPHLFATYYRAAVSINTIRVDINGNLLWTAQLVGCTNVDQCAQN
ncbi:MAG TPA: zf-HC2 domain-containing protein [Ktedonobacterales bacterium]|jgi:hypothetical protein